MMIRSTMLVLRLSDAQPWIQVLGLATSLSVQNAYVTAHCSFSIVYVPTIAP